MRSDKAGNSQVVFRSAPAEQARRRHCVQVVKSVRQDARDQRVCRAWAVEYGVLPHNAINDETEPEHRLGVLRRLLTTAAPPATIVVRTAGVSQRKHPRQ